MAAVPLYEALLGLELAAKLVLLAEQEQEPLDRPVARLRVALAEVHAARELAAELATATGTPVLHVLVGTPSLARATPAVA